MATEFRLPELGEGIESADVVKVLVSLGDTVGEEQPVMEIETEKAAVEVPAPVTGKVKEIRVKEGDKIKVGQLLFVIDEGDKGEEKEEGKEEAEVRAEKQEGGKVEAKEKEEEVEAEEEGEKKVAARVKEKRVEGRGGEERKEREDRNEERGEAKREKPKIKVKEEREARVEAKKEKEEDKPKEESEEEWIERRKNQIERQEEKREVGEERITEEGEVVEFGRTSKTTTEFKPSQEPAPSAPSVRRLAREIGVDINQVPGSGPGGRISEEDVKNYARRFLTGATDVGSVGQPVVSKAERPEVAGLPDFAEWGEVERKPMTNVRRKTAEHLSRAWTAPHVTQNDKADVTELEKLRKQYGKKVEEAGGKLTVTAIMLKVVASALKAFPQFNASVDMAKDEIIYKKYYHIGIAVDTDRGLLVPVIRDVDKKNILELSVELTEMSEKARNKKLALEEMRGGTFTITNLGGIGGTYFSPIINSPEVAVLGVSRANVEPVYINGQFEPRLMLPLSLSYDHRVIDGADAARFLRWLAEALEEPFKLVLEG